MVNAHRRIHPAIGYKSALPFYRFGNPPLKAKCPGTTPGTSLAPPVRRKKKKQLHPKPLHFPFQHSDFRHQYSVSKGSTKPSFTARPTATAEVGASPSFFLICATSRSTNRSDILSLSAISTCRSPRTSPPKTSNSLGVKRNSW